MDAFKTAWLESQNFEKGEALTKSELAEAKAMIQGYQKRGLISSKIISKLQERIPKLSEEYKASRAYWTIVKEIDTEVVAEASDNLGIDTYKVILSPHPCQICIDKTQNGGKIFKHNEVEKAGYGHAPPFHPNCYCILIPVVE